MRNTKERRDEDLDSPCPYDGRFDVIVLNRDSWDSGITGMAKSKSRDERVNRSCDSPSLCAGRNRLLEVGLCAGLEAGLHGLRRRERFGGVSRRLGGRNRDGFLFPASECQRCRSYGTKGRDSNELHVSSGIQQLVAAVYDRRRSRGVRIHRQSQTAATVSKPHYRVFA